MISHQFSACTGLLRAPFSPRATIERIQLQKFRRILTHCYNNVPYYREIMKARNLVPADFTCLEDLKKFPLLNKATVVESPSIFLARNIERGKLKKYVSSGSSGEKIITYAHWQHALLRDLVHTRALLLAGVNIFRKQVRIKPRALINLKSRAIHKICMMRVKNISSQWKMEKITAKLLSFRPHSLLAYPTFLEVLLDYLSVAEMREIKKFLQNVISRSEMLTRDIRQRLEHEFAVRVLDIYGCNEFGLLAFETREHNGYYCNEDVNILEILDKDDLAQNSLKGEIIVTSLHNYAMPLIRYNMKDSARFSIEPSKLSFKRMCKILGRVDDFIIAPSGKRISPGTMGEAIYGIPRIRGWQLIQRSSQQLALYLAISPPILDQKTRAMIESRIYQATGYKFTIEIYCMNSLPREISEKCKRVQSDISE